MPDHSTAPQVPSAEIEESPRDSRHEEHPSKSNESSFVNYTDNCLSNCSTVEWLSGNLLGEHPSEYYFSIRIKCQGRVYHLLFLAFSGFETPEKVR